MTKILLLCCLALCLAGCATLRDYSDYKQRQAERCAEACCCPCQEGR